MLSSAPSGAAILVTPHPEKLKMLDAIVAERQFEYQRAKQRPFALSREQETEAKRLLRAKGTRSSARYIEQIKLKNKVRRNPPTRKSVATELLEIALDAADVVFKQRAAQGGAPRPQPKPRESAASKRRSAPQIGTFKKLYGSK